MLYYPPLRIPFDVPSKGHYGSFGVRRKFAHHSGIDLYAPETTPVYVIETGVVVEVKWFTGPKANSDWWLPTRCVSIEGDTGVIVYGEIQELPEIEVGMKLNQSECIGHIKRVLRHDKGRPLSMLHVELLNHGLTDEDISTWELNSWCPLGLKDPFDILIQCKMNLIHILKENHND